MIILQLYLLFNLLQILYPLFYIYSSTNLISTISSSYIHSFTHPIIYSTIIDPQTMNISSSNIKCIKYSFQNEC